MSQASKSKKLSLAAQIFIALVLAVIAGLALQSKAEFAAAYIKPFDSCDGGRSAGAGTAVHGSPHPVYDLREMLQ